jgi:hypothetical protein
MVRARIHPAQSVIPGSRGGAKRPEGRHYEPGMALADGDLVMIHGHYAGGTTKSFIAMDIFRFEGDRVVEHWGVLQEEVPVEKTVAGNPMFTIPDLPYRRTTFVSDVKSSVITVFMSLLQLANACPINTVVGLAGKRHARHARALRLTSISRT